ncbi:MAG: hypothetical protein WCY15_14450 [Phenylobacterium sp.]|uniref:hypothetical protein n=1 Tax=Phenylobacterium sp. TaxID=1871053 RepID=UPI002A35CC55|nr:hypothetical protein [Phenylobacterium sp.]MDX9998832.1 hypothetical protein [Phenylobacterium sp.]
MPRQIDFAGQSGTVYRYTVLEEERMLPPAGANFVIARIEDRKAEVLFAGETDNLSAGAWRAPFEEARKAHGATDVLMRLNVRSSIRLQELEDLVAAHRPPMNGGPSPEAEAAPADEVASEVGPEAEDGDDARPQA